VARPDISPLAANGSDPAVAIAVSASWMARAVRKGKQLSGLAPLVATVIALAALMTSLAQLRQSRQTLKEQSIADVMHQSSQILMWAAEDPEAYAYFERDIFSREGRDQRTLEDLARADRKTRMRVQVACETIADFFEATYDQRQSFSPHDWYGWWTYMLDVYDESPVLREYFRRRGPWYDIGPALETASRVMAARRTPQRIAVRAD